MKREKEEKKVNEATSAYMNNGGRKRENKIDDAVSTNITAIYTYNIYL